MTHHLMVIKGEYLAPILSGRKRLECRLQRTRKPPFARVCTGDQLWIKPVSEPIAALATVRRVALWDQLSSRELGEIQNRYGADIAAPRSFYTERTNARVATIIQLANVRAIDPIPIRKTDQRSWVVLANPPDVAKPDAAMRLQHD